MIKVKVCGITNPGEALEIEGLGADYLGFNFYPKSKRYITPENAAPITSSLKKAGAVGVFVDESPESIRAIHQKTSLDALQLHGNETEEYLKNLKDLGLPLIKAVSLTPESDPPHLKWPSADFFLYDTRSKGEFGGTGEIFDWSLVPRDPDSPPAFLAGGLGTHNLEEAIKAVPKLFAVDLGSKVEHSPGVKNMEAIKACLEIARKPL